MIDGLLVTPLKRVEHPKGDIYHAMKASSPGYAGFGEAYFSTIGHGVIKGWKRHNRLTLNLVVPVGGIRFVIYDDRASSPSCGEFYELNVGPANYHRLTVPPGVWVAFQGMHSWNMLMNIIAAEHDPGESDDIQLDQIPYSWAPQSQSLCTTEPVPE
jgi:dTDP-4-dehydrorhamnose 3,5-epimerase